MTYTVELSQLVDMPETVTTVWTGSVDDNVERA